MLCALQRTSICQAPSTQYQGPCQAYEGVYSAGVDGTSFARTKPHAWLSQHQGQDITPPPIALLRSPGFSLSFSARQNTHTHSARAPTWSRSRVGVNSRDGSPDVSSPHGNWGEQPMEGHPNRDRQPRQPETKRRTSSSAAESKTGLPRHSTAHATALPMSKSSPEHPGHQRLGAEQQRLESPTPPYIRRRHSRLPSSIHYMRLPSSIHYIRLHPPSTT